MQGLGGGFGNRRTRRRRRGRESSATKSQLDLGKAEQIGMHFCCFGNAFAEHFDLEVTEVGVKLSLISSAFQRGGGADVLTVTDI